MPLEKGVSIIICTFNGSKRLPATLQHLAKQSFDKTIDSEIILIDNGSTDNSTEVAKEVWDGCGPKSMEFNIVEVKQKGKDKAVDKGLEIANYKYVIICDDDNWLEENYIQLSYEIMSNNKEIGMLGGQGLPLEGLILPDWFSSKKTYYAVGQQALISGEIKHYWPQSRFIWGAGAVINMEAYALLKKCGFSRILTYEKEGKIARSEDIELCHAIWLTGYKLWYDRRLIYEHAILQERLQWSSFMEIAKISIPAYHILRPYTIFSFTGFKNAPIKSYWINYIFYSLKVFSKRFGNPKGLVCLYNIILKRHEETHSHYINVVTLYQFLGVLKLGRKYHRNFLKIRKLQEKLRNEVEDYDSKLLKCQ